MRLSLSSSPRDRPGRLKVNTACTELFAFKLKSGTDTNDLEQARRIAMGEEADADWQDGLVEWGIEDAKRYYGQQKSWYCEHCAVEVYDRTCVHCGKTRRQRF